MNGTGSLQFERDFLWCAGCPSMLVCRFLCGLAQMENNHSSLSCLKVLVTTIPVPSAFYTLLYVYACSDVISLLVYLGHAVGLILKPLGDQLFCLVTVSCFFFLQSICRLSPWPRMVPLWTTWARADPSPLACIGPGLRRVASLIRAARMSPCPVGKPLPLNNPKPQGRFDWTQKRERGVVRWGVQK